MIGLHKSVDGFYLSQAKFLFVVQNWFIYLRIIYMPVIAKMIAS